MSTWFKPVLAVGTLLALTGAMLAFAPAGEAAKAPAPAASGKEITIGLVAKSNNNPVFQAARTGAIDAARELGKKYGVEVKIDWRTPDNEDAQKQAEFIQALSASGVAGIAVSASDAAKLKSVIDTAVDKGIAVSTFDSDVPTSKRFAYFGTNDFEGGKKIAEALAKEMGNKGVVAILAGNQTAPNLQARVRGVREGLKAHAEIEIRDVYYHVETAQDAVARVNQVMAQNPDITGWAMVGGWPLFTTNALDSVKGRAKVVAMDALPAQLAYVRSGDVQVLLGQQVYEWGYESVRLILEKVVNDKAPASPIVNAPLVSVTKANVDEYAKNWAKWLPAR